MKRRTPALFLALLGAIAVVIAAMLHASESVIDLIVIGTAVAIGDLFELRPANRAPLCVGFAFTLVLLRAATLAEFIAIVIAASLVSAALCVRRPVRTRVAISVELVIAGLAAGAGYRLVSDAFAVNSRTGTLIALVVAAVLEIGVADGATFWRDRRIAPPNERGADAAIVSTGVLMAVGYAGLGGTGRLGLWGPALFCVPLVATWYSFELHRRTRRTFLQTVQALGVAPELSGLARTGHVERVANLAVEMGRELGVSESDLRNLDTAAWLHHLGAVCLDEPEPGDALDATEVAQAGAEMLRATQVLAAAGDIVAAEPAIHRPPSGEVVSSSPVLGQVLKVASAYDELTSGDDGGAQVAIETLFAEPAYTFDAGVLRALEVVIGRRRTRDG